MGVRVMILIDAFLAFKGGRRVPLPRKGGAFLLCITFSILQQRSGGFSMHGSLGVRRGSSAIALVLYFLVSKHLKGDPFDLVSLYWTEATHIDRLSHCTEK
jgi:hypothetical protein